MSKAAYTGMVVVAALVPASVHAQADPFVWENATEFSYVATAGNSSSNTLGLKTSLVGSNEARGFKLELGGIRASSSITTRTAVGTTTVWVVNEVVDSKRSAENYFARSRYDQAVGGAFAFGGAGWERNTFSGVSHRVSLVAGMGKTWVEGEGGRFKTDLGGTYTIEKDVEPDPLDNEGFGGVRATIEGSRALNTTTDLTTTLVLDENLRDTEDLRLDWVASIAIALTEGLAFKTSYQMLFDNDPAKTSIPLFDAGNTMTGTVQNPSQKVDSLLTLSLVIKL
ncbi:MAG: DUF481 domain-containing protein [Gemmatimonadetes bacterium]|nr:DUF481 domain-containing protein [Gemmatimonadota bacterium]MDA1103562.1 DUF481 domain-containing protein [Gemmatimonadota bacterium]